MAKVVRRGEMFVKIIFFCCLSRENRMYLSTGLFSASLFSAMIQYSFRGIQDAEEVGRPNVIAQARRDKSDEIKRRYESTKRSRKFNQNWKNSFLCVTLTNDKMFCSTCLHTCLAVIYLVWISIVYRNTYYPNPGSY